MSIPVLPGMQFRFLSHNRQNHEHEVGLLVIAVPTGWMCHWSRDEFHLPEAPYFIPDKEHLINPYDLWDRYSYGLLEEITGMTPHQFAAHQDWQKNSPNLITDLDYDFVVGEAMEDSKMVRVKCPNCDKYHTHGYIQGITHRQSHCHTKVKGDYPGYYIYCE